MNEDNNSSKNREFICSCGKNYLSYAALFTHIKQKHDGKAPGPITRPRSERKRGRPRKNPGAQNQMSSQEQDLPQNGILKGLDINNNIQKRVILTNQNKKSIQSLGGGAFAAFTAYKPQSIRCSQKKDSQSSKKNLLKKMSCQNLERKCSASIGNLQQKQHNGNSELKFNNKSDLLNLCQNLQLKNRSELKKIFQKKNYTVEKPILNLQDEQLYNKLFTRIESVKRIQSFDNVLIMDGIIQLLKQFRQVLAQDQQTKIENSNSHTEHQNNDLINQYEQVLLLITFFIEGIKNECKGDQKLFQQKQVNCIPQYLRMLLSQFLPEKIKKYNIGECQLFKQSNLIKFSIYICNWISLKKTQSQLNKIKELSQINQNVLQTPNNKPTEKQNRDDWSDSNHYLNKPEDDVQVCPSISKIDHQ